MNSEMLTATILPPVLIMVGIGLGFLLLKIQGDKEESL